MMKRMLGIDHGDARVGIAISDELGMLAHPVETIPATPEKALFQRITAIVAEKDCAKVIVGLPRNMDGSCGPAAEKVRAFCEKLRAKLPETCPVQTWDERLSTVQAQRSLHAQGLNTKKSRKIIDQAAAQVILQSYLDSQALSDDIPAL